jgi:hypothetical protein
MILSNASTTHCQHMKWTLALPRRDIVWDICPLLGSRTRVCTCVLLHDSIERPDFSIVKTHMGIVILGVTAVKLGLLLYSNVIPPPWTISLSICTRRGPESGEGTLEVLHMISVAERVPLNSKENILLSEGPYIQSQCISPHPPLGVICACLCMHTFAH